MRHFSLIVRLFCWGLLLSAARVSLAQRGYSDASVAMNRTNGVLTPSQVVVEEYVNYHTHRITLPQAPATVALDLQWGNARATAADSVAVLQVGLATAPMADYSQRRPTNVCVVVDRSGSMAAEDRLEKVKAALRQFGRGLQPGDWVSVVAYDSDVSVPLPAQPARSSAFELAVAGLEPGGSTNLHAGMLQGYAEVLKHYNPQYTNRVILLTDGLANVGTVDPEQIVAASGAYNERGIELSTIGVGSDVNYSLLRQLAQRGHGLNHFIGTSAEDVRKAFDQELESLLAVLGREAHLQVHYPAELELLGVVGYHPQVSEQQVTIPLNNLNAGLTQVVLLRFRVRRGAAARLPVQAELRYQDALTQHPAALTQRSELQYTPRGAGSDPLLQAKVRKNYFIGYLAQALKAVATQVAAHEPARAVATGEMALREVARVYPALKDEDLRRVREIVSRTVEQLREVPAARYGGGGR